MDQRHETVGEGAGAPAADMEAIRRRLGLVRRRVDTQRFLRALFLDLLVAVSAFALFLIIDRLIATPLDPLHVFVGLAGAAVLVSLVRGALLGRASLLGAAILADDRLSLRERLSSAVHLAHLPAARRDEVLESWRELIERDGARALAEVDARRAFPVRLPATAYWSLGVLAAAVAIGFSVDQHDFFGWENARVAEATMKREVEREIEDLTASEELAELERFAEESEDPELKEVLDALKELDASQESPEEKTTEGEENRGEGEGAKKDALVKMSRLEDAIRKQAEKGDFDRLKDFLAEMNLARIDPEALTGEFQKALKEGDLAKAQEELAKLADEIKKLEEKQKAGTLSQAELERLEKLKRELGALSRSSAMLSKLGNQLGGMSASGLSLSPGDLKQMLQNLDQMGMQLQNLQQLMQQMQTLQQSLDLLRNSKLSMGQMHKCPNCGKLRKGTQPGGT